MKTNKKLLFCLIFASMTLVACGNEKVTTVSKIEGNTSTEVVKEEVKKENPAKLENNYKTLLQGRWRDTTDAKSEIAFRDNLRFDYYEGKELDKGEFTMAKTCEGHEPSKMDEYMIEGDMCWFVLDINAENLSLSYVGRGNSLFYVRVADTNESATSEDKDVVSDETSTIKLATIDTPVKDAVISSPLTIKGKAPSSWFFENSFPVQVADENGKILGEGLVYPNSEWTKPGILDFHAEVEFEKATTKTGKLILSADNPSGLPENDYSVEVPVKF